MRDGSCQRVEHPVGVLARDLVLELLAGKAPCLPFDGQNAAFASRTHADRARVRLQVALRNRTPSASPRHASLLTRNFRSISTFISSSHTARCRMLPLYRVSAPAYRRGVFHRKRLPYAGRFPGSGCMGNTPPPFPFGNAFYSRLRNKAKRCTDTDSVIVDAPLFPACPSGLVRPISMRILS